jgi:hypothetical protein
MPTRVLAAAARAVDEGLVAAAEFRDAAAMVCEPICLPRPTGRSPRSGRRCATSGRAEPAAAAVRRARTPCARNRRLRRRPPGRLGNPRRRKSRLPPPRGGRPVDARLVRASRERAWRAEASERSSSRSRRERTETCRRSRLTREPRRVPLRLGGPAVAARRPRSRGAAARRRRPPMRRPAAPRSPRDQPRRRRPRPARAPSPATPPPARQPRAPPRALHYERCRRPGRQPHTLYAPGC